MRFALLLLLVVPQDDPFKTLVDPAKRANDSTRKAAMESFRAAGKESGSHFVAALFLEKSDKQWKLAGDPAAADLDAFLAKYWSTAPADDKQLEALNAVAALAEKHAKSEAIEVFRLFAHAHLNAVGDKGATPAAKLGFTKDADRWARKEHATLYAIAKGFAKPAYIPAQVESSAKSSAQFGPRYIVALLEVQKTFSANTGYEALYKSIPTVAGPGASKQTVDHLKMLADGVKASTVCGACKAGKVDCDVCQGKKRTDINCPVCKGLGWSQKGDKANVLIQCVNCHGLCTLKNVACPACKASGAVECIVCAGKGWRDNFRGCRECKICAACHGRRQVETKCATCSGKGRVPPMVAGIPTILCGECKGNALIKGPCKACGESGLENCAKCGGKGARDGKSPERPKFEDVYQATPCDACGGKGWPLANVALPCERCFGLAVRIRPSLDLTKVLD
jgi:hypothetical protein